MLSYLIVQMAAAPQAELSDGSKFFRDGVICAIEHQRSSQGTYVQIRRYTGSDGSYILAASNPSWKSLDEGTVKIELRFISLPRIKDGKILKKFEPVPPSVEFQATVATSAIDGSPSKVILGRIDNESFNRLAHMGDLGVRFSIFYRGIMLTDYIRANTATHKYLSQCDDPFQK